MQLSIAICEDEDIQLKNLRTMVDAWATEMGHSVNIACFRNANNLLSELTCLRGFYDLFFLDVVLAGSIDGYTLAERLRQWHRAANLTFITTSDRSYQRAHDLNALEYLIKPVRQKDINGVLEKILRLKSLVPEGGLRLKDGENEGIFPYSSIIYLSSAGHEIRVNDDPRLSFRGSLDECHRKLGPSFARIHSSWLVHLGYVTKVETNFALMWDGKVCSIGGAYREGFLAASAAYTATTTVETSLTGHV